MADFRKNHMPTEVADIFARLGGQDGNVSAADHLFLTRALRASPRAWVPAAPTSATFQWVQRPQQPRRPEDVIRVAAHYTDGSMLDAHWQLAGTCARRGWAMAWQDEHGRNVATAHGRPPDWAPGILGAELWALLQCATESVDEAPFIIDCKAVQMGAQRGLQWATSPSRPLARAWTPVHHALDMARRQVIWMPAHCDFQEAGQRTRSDGRKLTTRDIAANRTVDRLAKEAAEKDRLPQATVEAVRREWAEVVAVAKWIGLVTVQSQQFDTQGDPAIRGVKRIRDSETAGRQQRQRLGTPGAVGRNPGPADDGGARRRSGRQRLRQHLNGQTAGEERNLARWLSERPPTLPQRRSADDIMAEVTRRVRARGLQQQ